MGSSFETDELADCPPEEEEVEDDSEDAEDDDDDEDDEDEDDDEDSAVSLSAGVAVFMAAIINM